MYCIHCGAELKSDAQFCSKCGNPANAGKKGGRQKKKQAAGNQKNTNGKTVSVPMPVLVIGGLVIVFFGIVLLTRQPGQQAPMVAQQPQNTMRQDVYAVATQFTCPCGDCQDNLAVCDCTVPHGAMEVKQFIREGLDQGRTPDQMVTAVQLKYSITPTAQ